MKKNANSPLIYEIKMSILLLPREHIFGNIGTNHNLFGKGGNMMKIPKRYHETAKKHLKLGTFCLRF